MNREFSRRRVFIAAAGLVTSVVIAGCGHARGERATDDAAANPPATNAPGADNTVPANADVKASAATGASVTAPKARVSRIRSRSYSVSAVPEENPTIYESGVRTSVVAEPANAAPAASASTASAVCFASVEVNNESYRASMPDAIAPGNTVIYDDFEGPKVPREQSMAPPAGDNPAYAAPRVEVTSHAELPANDNPESSRVVPCLTTGENAGNHVAAGAFLNDAQVMHAALMANSLDSAVSEAALASSQNPAVREFASMMIRDHTAGNVALAELIDRLRIAPAENDMSNDMQSDATAIIKNAPPPPAPVASTPPPARPKPVADDTIHWSNPFVAAVYRGNLKPEPMHRVDEGTVTTTTAPAANAEAKPGIVVSEFDRQYADFQVRFHQKVLDAMDTRLIPWAAPEERTALEEARVKVVAHLDAARNLQRALNAGNATH